MILHWHRKSKKMLNSNLSETELKNHVENMGL